MLRSAEMDEIEYNFESFEHVQIYALICANYDQNDLHHPGLLAISILRRKSAFSSDAR